jgi:hypothetical protein
MDSIPTPVHRRQISGDGIDKLQKQKRKNSIKSERKTEKSRSRRNSIEDQMSQSHTKYFNAANFSSNKSKKCPIVPISSSKKSEEKQFDFQLQLKKTCSESPNDKNFQFSTLSKNLKSTEKFLIIETENTDKSRSQSRDGYSPRSCSANRKRDYQYMPMSTKARKTSGFNSAVEDKFSLFKKYYKANGSRKSNDKEIRWDRSKAKSLMENFIISSPSSFAYSKNMVFPKSLKKMDKGMGKRQNSQASTKIYPISQVTNLSLSAVVGNTDKNSYHSSPTEIRTGRSNFEMDNKN